MKFLSAHFLRTFFPAQVAATLRKQKGVFHSIGVYFKQVTIAYVILTFFVLLVSLFFARDYVVELTQQRISYTVRLRYWEEVIGRHKNFPAAYYNASLFAYRLHQVTKAEEYLRSALQIDPNFTEAEELLKKIQKEM